MAFGKVPYKRTSGFLPVNACQPVNARLIFLCYRSRTNASMYLQNGDSLVFPVCGKMADNRVTLLKYKALKQM